MNRDRTSQLGGKANQEQSKPQTDWLVWSLQFVLGLLVGSGVGFYVARLLFRSDFTSFDQMLFVIAGVALCCGAFASFHGDRAWMSRSLWDWPEPRRTQKARTCSIVVGSVGAALVLIPVTLHLITRDRPTDGSSSSGLTSFLLILAAVPGFLLIRALRTGTGFWGFGALDREEKPLFYWIYVVIMALAVICILFGR